MKEYFGFQKLPFPKNIPVSQLFHSQRLDQLLARFKFFLKNGDIALLTGFIGSGKTTALRALTDSLDPNKFRPLYLPASFHRCQDFYRTISVHLGLTPKYFASDAREQLRKHLLSMHHVQKLRPLIILDEAQNLPPLLLEELRMLSNFNMDTFSPASFILCGHHMLKAKMETHDNEALNQRISVRYHLEGLSLEETCAYIRHQLEIAGATATLFAEQTLAPIHEATKGIPRKINNLCRACLLAAMTSEKKFVDESVFEQARSECG